MGLRRIGTVRVMGRPRCYFCGRPDAEMILGSGWRQYPCHVACAAGLAARLGLRGREHEQLSLPLEFSSLTNTPQLKLRLFNLPNR